MDKRSQKNRVCFTTCIKEMVREFAKVYVGEDEKSCLPLAIIQDELRHEKEWNNLDWEAAWNLIIDDMLVLNTLNQEIPDEYDKKAFEEVSNKYKEEINYTIKYRNRNPEKEQALLLITTSDDDVEYADIIIKPLVITANKQYVIVIRNNRFFEIYSVNNPIPFDIFELDTSENVFRELEYESDEFKEAVNMFETREKKDVIDVIDDYYFFLNDMANEINEKILSKCTPEDRVKFFSLRKPLKGKFSIVTQKIY